MTHLKKKSFWVEALQGNIEAFVQSVVEARPKAIKGQGIPGYILKMSLSTTMGPSVPVALPSLEKKYTFNALIPCKHAFTALQIALQACIGNPGLDSPGSETDLP